MRQPFGDLALQAAAQADEALRVLREQLLVDARLVVEALRVAGRHELDQVVVALDASPRAAPGDSASRRGCRSWCAGSPGATYTSQPRIGFTPRCRAWSWKMTDENRLPCSVTAIAGIFSCRGLIEQFVDPARAVEQRELGVQVQVDEVGHLCHLI